eukprot:7249536-Pyramimonas_sp.AAC.1
MECSGRRPCSSSEDCVQSIPFVSMWKLLATHQRLCDLQHKAVGTEQLETSSAARGCPTCACRWPLLVR